MKRSPHITSISVLSLIILVFIGIYGYSFWKVKDFRSKTDILEVETHSNDLLVKRSNEKTATEKIKEDQKNISKLPTYFLNEGEEFVLIQAFETLCGEISISCDIKPVGIVKEPGTSSQFQNVQTIISTEGTFIETYQLLSLLENMPYRSKISNVELSTISAPTPLVESTATTTSTTTPTTSRRNSIWKGTINIEVTTTSQ